MADNDVLIVGAGPTGLVLAIWLTKQGVGVRIIDKSKGPGETSRAMVVQARTLELYRQIDMADDVVAAGYKAPAMNIWARGKHRARLSLSDAGREISPCPFVLIFPQDQHERLLLEHLERLGVRVERQTQLLSFDEREGEIEAVLDTPNGEETCTARYLMGCDGAHSLVRHGIGAGFEGGTYRQIFYVADVEARDVDGAREAHIAFERSDFVLVLPYGKPDQYRLIGTVQDERASHPENLTFDDVDHEALAGLGIKIARVNWFSHYRVHHRVTDHFRKGRVFLLGDAAHVHSPAGGQGMNTGIADAVNLAWKVSMVVKGQAPDALLDSYEKERMAFARKLVETTDRLFTFVTAEGSFANVIRAYIAPAAAGLISRIGNVREYMFRVVSQTMLDYTDSPLSRGTAGRVRGGERLPFLRFADSDNYAALGSLNWQVHVYGTPSGDLANWCARRNMPLHVFPWHEELERHGLATDAAYLLRPDGYVAVAEPEGNPVAFETFLLEQGLSPSAA